jgi:V8-like Glu-specific endopeptidase
VTTIYWVKYSFSVSFSSVSALGPDLFFRGFDLAGPTNGVSISLAASPQEPWPFHDNYIKHSFVTFAGFQLNPSPPGYELLNTSISDYYLIGSRPDPTPFLGPLSHMDASGPQGVIPPFDYNSYVWAQISVPYPILFTTGADDVIFNNLRTDQVAAINAAPTQLYNALGGNDTVTLPNKDSNGNYILSPTVNATWDPNQTFTVGALTDTSSTTDTITGGNGDYKIAVVGGATVDVAINGVGSSTLTTGSGTDIVSISGGGKLGTLKIIGDPQGPASIGADSTLELNGPDSGSIAFADSNAILKIDGTSMPSGVINGYSLNDTIDLAAVPYNSTTYTVFETSKNVLQVVSNGLSYDLHFDPSQKFTGGFQINNDGQGGTEIQPVTKPITGYSTLPASPLSAALNPYSAVVQIKYIADGFAYLGSGFIIGPHTILTAAHVLQQPSPVGPRLGLDVTINDVNIPLGVISTFADPQYVSTATFDPINETHDFGVINTTADLSSYGTFQLESGFSSGTINISGFPGGSSSQFNSIQNAILNEDLLEDPGDLGQGASGGPVWVYDGTTFKAVGIYVATGTDASVQITPTNLAEILGWEALALPCQV